jgi:hypothetical protein
MRGQFVPKARLVISALAFVVLGNMSLQAAAAEPFPKPTFNAKGELLRPDISYREWVYVGTPLTPNDLNPPAANFPEFHNVYIHPSDFDHWKRTGRFPDGTVLVKELVTVGATQATSGNGYFMGEYIGLETTIKDSVRFPDEPGNWAYFSFGHSYPLADTAAPFPAAACNACHDAAAADDWVFTQYYPVLRAAKGATSGRVMNSDAEEFQEIAEAMASTMATVFDPTAETPDVDSAVPTDLQDLFSYLQDGSYKNFAAQESGQHPTRGPHTNVSWPVRVFMDPLINASLAAGNTSHPAGSSIVKEMYNGDGDLQGWAVMVKTQDDSAGGKGWFWYEVTSTRSGSDPVAAGNGVQLCQGCHFIGRDFVLTDYPLQ